jgi:DNA-binding CsgD family transcriptional regulator
VKLLEDDATMVLLVHHRPPGDPLVDPGERGTLQRLGAHVARALGLQHDLGVTVDRDALGYALLDRLHQPVLLLDCDRNIMFRSEAAKAIVDRADMLCEQKGVLGCRNTESDIALTLALQELDSLPPASRVLGKAPAERRTLRLRTADGSRMMIATLLALRPVAGAGTIGRTTRALLTIHEPHAASTIAPSFLVDVFQFTPAEARVAVRLTAGLTLEEIAAEFKVSVTTVRTQLSAIFDKTGTRRQADVMRLLAAVTAF